MKALVGGFQPREGPSRGLLRDCENTWVMSTLYLDVGELGGVVEGPPELEILS